MKKQLKKHMVFLLSMLLFLISCNNQYEKKVIGYYEVGTFERKDSLDTISINLPTLTLKNDKTFSLAFKDNTTKGKWTADDNGDATWISFSFNNQGCQGSIIGSDEQPEIWIYTPSNFYCPKLKTLVFKKVNKK